VRLEPLEVRFAPDFDDVILDPDVVRFTRVPTRVGDGFVEAWLGAYEQGWEDGSRAGFAIVGGVDGAFLGFVALIRIDWDALDAEIGYIVAPAARGRGVARRAIELVSRWSFDQLGLRRIEAWIDPENEASLRVAERVGYTREGLRRSTLFKEGRRVDMAIYSLLPGELP
jgi:RimJ/RimL family protein N-acetyltransferase